MRHKVFLDTNILLSGIFFNGNESRVLELIELELITCEDVVNELKNVVKKKLKYLGERSLEIAILETDRALSDISIIKESKYSRKIKNAENFITYKKDIPILASVLTVNPDYFLTGDSHFFTKEIKAIVNVRFIRFLSTYHPINANFVL